MFIVTTVTAVKTRELSMDMRERIITQRDSEDSGKGCKAIFKVLQVYVSTVRSNLKIALKHHTKANLKGRDRKP